MVISREALSQIDPNTVLRASANQGLSQLLGVGSPQTGATSPLLRLGNALSSAPRAVSQAPLALGPSIRPPTPTPVPARPMIAPAPTPAVGRPPAIQPTIRAPTLEAALIGHGPAAILEAMRQNRLVVGEGGGR